MDHEYATQNPIHILAQTIVPDYNIFQEDPSNYTEQFLYQNKAREVVGIPDENEEVAFAYASVEGLLAACQIAGPSLVELYTWRWLYERPDVTQEGGQKIFRDADAPSKSIDITELG